MCRNASSNSGGYHLTYMKRSPADSQDHLRIRANRRFLSCSSLFFLELPPFSSLCLSLCRLCLCGESSHLLRYSLCDLVRPFALTQGIIQEGREACRGDVAADPVEDLAVGR